MITVYRWHCSTRVCERVAAHQLPASAAEIAGDDVCWVDLADPTPEEEQLVFEKFLKVHTLTLGDITMPRREPNQGAHLPKAEEFPDYLFVITNPLPPGLAEAAQAQPSPADGPRPAIDPRQFRKHRPQLSAILTPTILITHHYQPLGCVDEAHRYLDRHGDSARRGPDYLFHLILDAMVDEYAPVVDRISDRLDKMERRMFTDPSPKLLHRLLHLKRLVIGLRKTLVLEREVLARLVRGEFDLVDDREVAYYRNVYDHLVRYTELVEAGREMISDLMQTHLSATSNRLNQIMKVLTMISTVVLPMTLIAGVYGMNFEDSVWPGYHTSWGFWFALGLMALTGIVAFTLFRRRKWV